MAKNKRQFHLTLGIFGIVLVVIITLQNAEVVSLNFLIWQIQMSRIILILATLIIGILLGYILKTFRK
jgi:lipopolysaccharide assembly protein A